MSRMCRMVDCWTCQKPINIDIFYGDTDGEASFKAIETDERTVLIFCCSKCVLEHLRYWRECFAAAFKTDA